MYFFIYTSPAVKPVVDFSSSYCPFWARQNKNLLSAANKLLITKDEIIANGHDMEELPDTLTEFKVENWHAPVNYTTVYSTDDICITFKHGRKSKHKPIDARTPRY